MIINLSVFLHLMSMPYIRFVVGHCHF